MPSSRCEHGETHACPHPGCERGVAGDQLVVCGVDGAKYFTRGFAEVSPGVLSPAWIERPRAEVTLARIVRRAAEKGSDQVTRRVAGG